MSIINLKSSMQMCESVRIPSGESRYYPPPDRASRARRAAEVAMPVSAGTDTVFLPSRYSEDSKKQTSLRFINANYTA